MDEIARDLRALAAQTAFWGEAEFPPPEGEDRVEAGHAELEPVGEVEIAPGVSIGMMPDDIHSVFIPRDCVIRHLHFYGRALDTLSERLIFNLGEKPVASWTSV